MHYESLYFVFVESNISVVLSYVFVCVFFFQRFDV